MTVLSNSSSPTQHIKMRLQPKIICFSAKRLSQFRFLDDMTKSKAPKNPTKYNVKAIGVVAASKGSIISFSMGKRKKQRMNEIQPLIKNSIGRHASHTLNILRHIRYVLYITFMHKLKGVKTEKWRETLRF